ncbi:MAG: plasmid stabilization system protein [Gammaproteobacteria bacterium CG22_combo_CG10-13_8_21_14_all_40_8]|nr:MAG: plasmid stabilization system protein [Gammaproteobacteria bacterium CG22_combo_CG10-13_8_21_14_all_40_8]
MKLKFTAQALHDLYRLRKFIAEKNPKAATKYSEKLLSTIRKLESNPMLGKALEAELDGRELIAGHYVIHYTMRDELIYILKIWHGKEER